MANSYSPIEFVLRKTAQVVPASTTATVSEEIPLTAAGSQNLRIDLKVSAVTAGSGITAKLQHKSIDTWTDLAGANASVAISASGEVSLTQLMARAADQANMPIKKQVRVVIVTLSGATVTVDAVKVSQPQ